MTPNTTETYRLQNFVSGEAAPPVAVCLRATSRHPAESLDRVKEVMRTIATRSGGTWLSDQEWEAVLPDWFVQKTKRHTEQEIEANPKLWDWGAWLDAMKLRGWEWWSSASDREGWTANLVASCWPYVIGPLEYLAHVSGAEEVVVSDEVDKIVGEAK